MRLLNRLAVRAAQELARNPELRGKIVQGLAETSRILNKDLKPRARRAWKDAQPGIESAKRGLGRFVQELREEYRKGRDGK